MSVTAPLARTTTTFGAILGIRELSDGRVLVNDAGRHQVTIFDRSLTSGTVTLDSMPGSATSYGPQPGQIIPYLGDSTIQTRGFGEPKLMLDGVGHVARAIALPEYNDGIRPMSMQFRRSASRRPQAG